MLRYALIIVAFVVLMVYILVLSMRGTISGRFRNVSLVLLAVLLILVGTGLYYNMTHYAVQSVEEEFSSNRTSIMERIRTLYREGRFEQARELAQTYVQVNDPELDRLYRQSREAELLARLEQLTENDLEARREIFRQLERLTAKEAYARKLQETVSRIKARQEEAILDVLEGLHPQAYAQKALGYSRLQSINPNKVLYKQRHDAYLQKVENLIQGSPWNDVCSSKSPDPCSRVGFRSDDASSLEQDSAREDNAHLEVLGVSLRPKGTRISEDGRVAPEDGTYYIVHQVPGARVTLINVTYLRVFDPFTHPEKNGGNHDQPKNGNRPQ
jgi:hypothetical protein